MDEILYLEPDEEITSVIDKIKNAKNKRIGLVVPREATILQSVVNLRLLQREAASLGKEIAIITTDKIGRNLAAQVGLEIFNSIEEQKPIYQPPRPLPDSSEMIEIDMAPKKEEEAAPSGVQVHHFQEEPVSRPQRDPFVGQKSKPPVFRPNPQIDEKPLPSGPEALMSRRSFSGPTVGKFLAQKEKDFKIFKKIIWPIAIVLLILIGLGTYLLLPKATITIYTPSENLQKTLNFSVNSQTTNLDIEKNVLPGKLIEVSDEKKETFSATGQKNIGTKASATITFYNSLDSNNHNLAAGAQLSSSSKTFVLKSAISIPGAGVSGGSVVPGTAKGNIEAEDVGAQFNVKAGRFTILGLSSSQQAGIYGQSSSDLSGGISKQVQVVSQSDYDNAKNKIIGELSDSVAKDLQKKIGEQKVLDKAQVTPEPTITTTANVNSEATSFDMNIKYTKQVMVFDNSQMKDFLVVILTKQVPQDKMVAIASDSDVGLEVTKAAYDNNELDLKANVIAKITAKIDVTAIKTAVLGKNSLAAESYVKSQPSVTQVKVDFWPKFWLKRIPNLERNVTLKIEYENK